MVPKKLKDAGILSMLLKSKKNQEVHVISWLQLQCCGCKLTRLGLVLWIWVEVLQDRWLSSLSIYCDLYKFHLNCVVTVEIFAYVTPSGYRHETAGFEPCLRTVVSYLPVRRKKNWREPKLGTHIIIIISRLSQDLLESSEQPLTSKGQPGPVRYWSSVAAHPCPSHPYHREALIPCL